MDNLLSYYGEECASHPVINKHLRLLNTLLEDRVCCVIYSRNNGFAIQECCDDWFSHTLTKEECIELSEMFAEIADEFNT